MAVETKAFSEQQIIFSNVLKAQQRRIQGFPEGAPTYYYRRQTKFGARLYVYRCVSVHGGGMLWCGAWSRGVARSRGGFLVTRGVPGPGGYDPGGGVPAPGGVWFSGDACSWGVPGGDPQMATAAGSTHPTGMHSCFG